MITGFWWILFSQYTYRNLPDVKNEKGDKVNIWKNGFKELSNVFKRVLKTKRLKRYLMAFWLYSMGIQTVMLMAVQLQAMQQDSRYAY